MIMPEDALETAGDSDVDDEDNKDIFSLGKDPVKTFYIGSITVIGLFVLFRLIQKN